MPRDVHKSLELLEEFHAELFRPTDAELKYSIEKVIGIFKTNLFNALCDIQDFYDNVLLNERLPLSDKVFESRRFADRWEQRQGGLSGVSSTPAKFTSYHTTENKRPAALMEVSSYNKIVDEFGREWEVEEVLLDAKSTGLGFSISGGRDRDPEPDHYIRVTDISPGGAVDRDGRIKVGDVILKVNKFEVVNVDHQFAVDALQGAGAVVQLLVKRLKPYRSLSQSQLNESQYRQSQDAARSLAGSRSRSLHQLPQPIPASSIAPRVPSRMSHQSGSGQYIAPQPLPESTKAPRMVTLRKGEGGLGFNIVGGEDGEPIYVSHVLPGGVADLSSSVKKGDVLLRVGDIDLQGASHGQAALTLKSIPPNSYVHLLLQYRPREYHQFEDKVERLRNDLLLQQQNATVGFR